VITSNETESDGINQTEVESESDDLPYLASSTIHYDSSCSCLYIIGGIMKSGEISNSVYKLKLELNENIILNVEKIQIPIRIYGHASIMDKDKIILVGGISDFDHNDDFVFTFDLLTNELIIERIEIGNCMLLMHGHQIHGNREKIKILGGGNNCFSFGSHFNSLLTTLTKET